MQESLSNMQSSHQNDDSFETYDRAAEKLLKFLKVYRDFFQAIIDHGASKPKNTIAVIGIYLVHLTELSKDIEEIDVAFKRDFPDTAEKLLVILEELPAAAREVFKALTQICLLNETPNDESSQSSASESDLNMLNSIDAMFELLHRMGFIFDEKTVRVSVGMSEMFDTTHSIDLLKSALESFEKFKEIIEFRREATTEIINGEWILVKSLISYQFANNSEYRDDRESLNKALNFKKIYENAARTITNSIKNTIDSFRSTLGHQFMKTKKAVDAALVATKNVVLEKYSKAKDTQGFMQCIHSEVKRDLVDVGKILIHPLENMDKQLELKNTTLSSLALEFDKTVAFHLAKLALKAKSLEDLDKLIDEVIKVI